jgi:hypothetical protein
MASTPRAPQTDSAGDGTENPSHDKLFKKAFRRFFRAPPSRFLPFRGSPVGPAIRETS